MTNFVGVLLLLCAWAHQIAHFSAAPSDRIFSLEFNNDDSKIQQDDDLKSANGIDDVKMTNGVISQESSAQVEPPPNFNGTTENVEPAQKQAESLGPLSVSVALQNESIVGKQYSINFTDISYLLVCSAKFRVTVPGDATIVSHSNMTPVPNTSDQFTLPNDVRLYPGLSYTAEVTLNGNGPPEITILNTVTVLTTEECPSYV